MPNRKKGLNLLLRALGSRNYRLYFFGQAVSLIGTWMQQIAMRWLVYRLTKSALLLGVVGFASDIPVFLLASYRDSLMVGNPLWASWSFLGAVGAMWLILSQLSCRATR